MVDFFVQNGGILFAVLGAILAAALSGVGSARGVGHVGQGAAAIVIDDPAKFGQSLILELLPGTQGLYGMIIAIIVMVTKFDMALPLQEGVRVFLSCLPIAIVGYASAIHQGNVAYAGLEILAKNESQSMKGVIYAVMVETYAILAFIISLIFVFAA
ncbi:V-type ATP synthase subunit K [Kallipyga massiliensis]|uniref:V-type ATP synthase subunit K n=1 Tax=Kallipyga massiliensis TaxID=1472764 RepID=UPI0026EEA7C0|nr:V-type ATP synthase subunit K [Kallipyga massiliensis]